MVTYHDRWLIAEAASICLQDLVDSPEKYDVGDFDKEIIYQCLTCWLKRFPGKPSVDYPADKKILYGKLDVTIQRKILDVSSQVVNKSDADSVLRSSVGID